MKKVIGLLFIVMGLTVYYSKAWWPSSFNRPVSNQVNDVPAQKLKNSSSKNSAKALDQDEDDYYGQGNYTSNQENKPKVEYEGKIESLAHNALVTLKQEYDDSEEEFKGKLHDIAQENSKVASSSIVNWWYGTTAKDKKEHQQTEQYIEDNSQQFVSDFYELYDDEDYK